MDVEIKYCNNIDNACITLSENKLNIKFAPNGTGKSTISRAILHSVSRDAAGLNSLLPFKFRAVNESRRFSAQCNGYRANSGCNVL